MWITLYSGRVVNMLDFLVSAPAPGFSALDTGNSGSSWIWLQGSVELSFRGTPRVILTRAGCVRAGELCTGGDPESASLGMTPCGELHLNPRRAGIFPWRPLPRPAAPRGSPRLSIPCRAALSCATGDRIRFSDGHRRILNPCVLHH